ncbi:hypothetical protein BQ8482_460013 [Mesorhizobium delmotii]|uniref:Transposase IS116/IS110/IS902 C-terminal domain-containing protein n=1 Tax=Mesorhizobium delmotii TaxID=1631247 RepID=A0A2P9ATR0_9HYPH|nr:hypothetical protein BQ8482_460013 [Mesorhizobium delmotii]
MSYFGLNPRVRRSGLGLAQYGRISKHGRSHARAMLVEAAWAAAKARTAQSFLPAHSQQARPSGCGGRGRPQARHADLAHADEAGGLAVGEACVGGGEAATTRPQGRRGQRTRCWSSRFSLRL